MVKKEEKLVSIIMPTYNCGKFIGETIDSVLNQTYDNWELIIVDDCSKDNTSKVVEKYLKEGLRDRAITRDLTWGIDVPVDGFEDKRMYVWIEAVLGYLTTTQRYCEENGLDWEKFWKAGNTYFKK